MLAFKSNLYASYFWLSCTAKADCAYDFLLVFEPVQLILSIYLNSWAGSKTSQKVPAQTTFAVISKSNELGIRYKSLWRIFQYYVKEPRIYLAQIINRRSQPTKFTKIIETIRMFINSRDTTYIRYSSNNHAIRAPSSATAAIKMLFSIFNFVNL